MKKDYILIIGIVILAFLVLLFPSYFGFGNVINNYDSNINAKFTTKYKASECTCTDSRCKHYNCPIICTRPPCISRQKIVHFDGSECRLTSINHLDAIGFDYISSGMYEKPQDCICDHPEQYQDTELFVQSSCQIVSVVEETSPLNDGDEELDITSQALEDSTSSSFSLSSIWSHIQNLFNTFRGWFS